ncbi:MAG: GtrA family protein [Candidatus Paceibacterota bacterium]
MAIKKDYLLVSLIGLLFGLFSAPIIKNLNLSFLPFSWVAVIVIVVLFTLGAPVALFIASFVGKKIPVIFQFAKFAAVGAINTFVDWGILNFLILLTGTVTGVGFSIFKGISFLFSASNSYVWNKFWTFGATNKENSGKEFGKFIIISLIGFLINVGVASFIVNYISPFGGFSLTQWANLGALVATLVALVWNFVGYKFFVFDSK